MEGMLQRHHIQIQTYIWDFISRSDLCTICHTCFTQPYRRWNGDVLSEYRAHPTRSDQQYYGQTSTRPIHHPSSLSTQHSQNHFSYKCLEKNNIFDANVHKKTFWLRRLIKNYTQPNLIFGKLVTYLPKHFNWLRGFRTKIEVDFLKFQMIPRALTLNKLTRLV